MTSEGTTIIDALDVITAQQPDAVALDYHSERWTYRELSEAAARTATGLASLGVGRGDRVTLFSQNVPEHVLVFLALARLGGINVSINPQWTASEARYLIEDAGSKVVIASADTLKAAQESIKGLGAKLFLVRRSTSEPGLHDVEVPDGVGDFEEVTSAPPMSEVFGSPSDPVTVWYTSGTTGRPKGAIWSQEVFLNNALVTAKDTYGVSPGDVALCPIPIAHNGLSVAALGPMLAGGTFYLHRRVNPADMLRCMLDAGVTYMATAPAVMNILMIHAAEAGVETLPAMKTIAMGGAVITTDMLARLQKFMPNCECGVIYAGSEGYYGTWLPSEAPEKLGSIGRPYLGMEWKVVDDLWNDVGVGEVGNIASRGSGCMLGYWNRPDVDKQVFHDGWMAIGDLGRMDEDGYLWFVGRDRDVIDSGGFNVYASEVESVLATVGSVGTVGVVGIPDAVLGERVVAYVSPNPGAEIDVAELEERAKDHLARYKQPSEYRVREALPINSLGKVMKHLLD
ncbi:class I adenylate-forming enzyme family protein [Microtetraspora sp. NBRC 16547]|uniref:class I adenylate-forming enzyme family protein n=1 Tax=Microtetraspora sp. NBRC 16547 TaxID=3030993 RepID=UPI0024A4C0DC|nr:class I adenylate-forming enzyme family protein [Microtetraspora sp. NBRC 16547]GLW99314.1 putative fatty-acid-CoA ligase FadD [Microtetraspora sp. NBRC 16547]